MKSIRFLSIPVAGLLLLSGTSVALSAQSPEQQLMPVMKFVSYDGSILLIPIDTTTRLVIPNKDSYSIGDHYATITTIDGKHEVVFLGIDRITFETQSAGIENIECDGHDSWMFDVDNLVFNIVTGDTSMTIFDINGRIVINNALPLGLTTVAIGHLDSGMYILHFNNNSLKFIKR